MNERTALMAQVEANQHLVGKQALLRFWGGDGYAEMAGTITAIEPDEAGFGDSPIVILAEDDDMAYFLHQVVEVEGQPFVVGA